MPFSADPIPARFSPAQRESITAWADRRPSGFRVRFADEDGWSEVAEVFQLDPQDLCFLLQATGDGQVVLTRMSGGAWHLDTVEQALAHLLRLEAMSGAS